MRGGGPLGGDRPLSHTSAEKALECQPVGLRYNLDLLANRAHGSSIVAVVVVPTHVARIEAQVVRAARVRRAEQ